MAAFSSSSRITRSPRPTRKSRRWRASRPRWRARNSSAAASPASWSAPPRRCDLEEEVDLHDEPVLVRRGLVLRPVRDRVEEPRLQEAPEERLDAEAEAVLRVVVRRRVRVVVGVLGEGLAVDPVEQEVVELPVDEEGPDGGLRAAERVVDPVDLALVLEAAEVRAGVEPVDVAFLILRRDVQERRPDDRVVDDR